MSITIPLIIIALLPILAAWRQWVVTDHVPLNRTRKSLFIVALCLASAAVFEYVAFVLYTGHIGGFGTDFAAVFRWTRPGFWISMLALLLAFFGRGKSRMLGVTSALVMVILWIIPDWAM